ncbi:hypothetical protein ACWGJQ_03500 [Peribacillus simplex]
MKRRNFLRSALLFFFAFFFGYTVKKENGNMVIEPFSSVTEINNKSVDSNFIIINMDSWGITERDEAGTNASIINSYISRFDPNKFYDLVVNKVYNISAQININHKKVKIRGLGGFKATTRGITIFKAKNCPDILFKDILIEGNSLARIGIDLENCPRYFFENLSIQNIGNEGINNVHAIYLSFGNDEGYAHLVKIENVISSAVATGVNIDNYRDNTKLSKGLTFQDCTIKNIQPPTDADGIKILQIDYESDITIERCRFIKCSKRGLKVQSKKVYSRDNYFEDSFYSAIDFQTGGGVSENDRIIITSNFGADQIIALSGDDNEIRGLRVKCSNHSNTDGIVISSLAGETINKIKLDDIVIVGTRYPVMFKYGVTMVGELALSKVDFSEFSGTSVIPSPRPATIKKLFLSQVSATPKSTYYGFINGGATGISKYLIINNDVGSMIFDRFFPRTSGTIRGNIGHLFDEENGVRRYYSTTIPSATNNTMFHYAKKGDESINTNLSELGNAGSRYVIKKWVCIEDGNFTNNNKGTWVEDILVIGE